MNRVKSKALTIATHARNPNFLIASTVVTVAAGTLAFRSTYCQHDSKLKDSTDDSIDQEKGSVVQGSEIVDSPYSPYNLRKDQHYYSPDLHGPRFRRSRGFTRNRDLSYTEEPLVPALLYITAAAFAGSFVSRNRNFIIRFMSSSALTIGTAAYCIPRTTNRAFYELRTYDYTELAREWELKCLHTRNSAISKLSSHGDVREKIFADNNNEKTANDIKTRSKSGQVWESALEPGQEERYRYQSSSFNRGQSPSDREYNTTEDKGGEKHIGERARGKIDEFNRANQNAVDKFDKTINNAGKDAMNTANSFSERSRQYIHKFEDELDSVFTPSRARSRSVSNYDRDSNRKDTHQRRSSEDHSHDLGTQIKHGKARIKKFFHGEHSG